MALDHASLESLRQHHPAWRLLCSDHAPLVVSFLHRSFVAPNRRAVAAEDLAEWLEDELFRLREGLGPGAFPRSAMDYLNDWANPEKAWLRKYYRQGTDEAQFDLTPATEKAIAWLASLGERSFVGTESRLLTLFDLLRQMSEGSERDPLKRLAELEARQKELDAEVARLKRGEVAVLDDTGVRDRFLQFTQMARELLGDFREVEANFRRLDRSVRERITLWEGSKGALLQDILGERDAIADTDQGRSFRAFWDFLLDAERQEELGQRLNQVMALPAVQQLQPDTRLRRVHHDWLEAGEHTQRTVAQLSHQLRRFLDDQTWLENRRIMHLLQGIEAKALAVREQPPLGPWVSLELGPELHLPMERPLHTPSHPVALQGGVLQDAVAELDASALYEQVVVDKGPLVLAVRKALQAQAQISLAQLLEATPLAQGLAELVAYLQLGHEAFRVVVDEREADRVGWWGKDREGRSVWREASLPRVIFVRQG